MTYLTHDAVGIQEPAFRRIERHADDGVLEDGPIALRQLLHLAFLLFHLCLVGQRGDDVYRLAIFIFGYSASIHVVPVGLARSRIVIVPAIMALAYHVDAISQSLYEGAEAVSVVGMYIGVTLLYTHIIAEHRLSVQVVHDVVLQVKTHHVIAADVERHHHSLLLVKHDIHIQFSIFTFHLLILHSSLFTLNYLSSSQSQWPCKVSRPTRWCPYHSLTAARWCRPSDWQSASRWPGRDRSPAVPHPHDV